MTLQNTKYCEHIIYMRLTSIQCSENISINFFKITAKMSATLYFMKLIKKYFSYYYRNILKMKLLKKNFFF